MYKKITVLETTEIDACTVIMEIIKTLTFKSAEKETT